MTLARTRLVLGITAVGATVLVASAALWLDLPGAWLSTDTETPLLPALAEALVWPLLWTLLLLPLDLVGGTVAVRHRPSLSSWLGTWLRGVSIQLVVLATVGIALIALSRALGLFGAVAGVTVAAAVIASQTATLTRLGASTRQVTADSMPFRAAGLSDVPVDVVETGDEAFVGGFSGLVRPRLIVPAAWLTLPRGTLHGLLVRRRLASTAPRVRGIGLALVWLALGATLSGFVVALPDSAAGLVRFSLATTLWSFLGVLLLPTPSRRAVIALDQQAARVAGVEAVALGIAALDRWQDDEPTRGRVVETVFHPVPASGSRLATLGEPTPRLSGAWRVARMALPLGLGGWSLLGRAVHCNLGRPALWWMLPGD
jgi:hypothetical protein